MPADIKNKSLFIFNPKAGIIPSSITSKILDFYKSDLTCIKSPRIEDTSTLIRENFSNYDFFIAAGGDGTVHSVATELINTGKILGVFPVGSGNGFAKEFGFRKNINSLLSDIRKSEVHEIDVIEINGHLCLNLAGIGLDSFVAHSFEKMRTRGFWTYAGVTLKYFFRLQPFEATIKLSDDEAFTEELFDITIANTRQFGYNAYIAPDALPDDGIIDLVLIKPFPKILAPVFIYRLFTKKFKDSKYIRYIRTRNVINIKTDEKRLHIDGEPLEISNELIIRIKTKALKVLKTSKYKRPQVN
jgi:YegS/Rv2252/BmrU family lipid kinase